MNRKIKIPLLTGLALLGATASAEVMDRPVGIKIGQRMTLKPYVGAAITVDSNVDGRKDGDSNVFWTISPGFGLDYKAENWSFLMNAQYQYNAYMRERTWGQQDYHGITENLVYRWTNTRPGERGWSLMLAQSYQKTIEDTMTTTGTEYGTDRQTVQFNGGLERYFGNGLHADVNVGYYWLDYNCDDNYTRGLYGWDRTMIGSEVGWAASPWFDFLVAGSYQYYNQKNINKWYEDQLSNESDGYSVQAGFGSKATERITYRLLAGWSRFIYGSSESSDGFTYSANGNWVISETWRTMLLASSYYQPTEREYGSSQRVDLFSWGIAHSMVQGKLHANLDLAYRHEMPEYSYRSSNGAKSADYTLDTLTIRLGLNYVLNRYLSLFTDLSYRKSIGDGESTHADSYDYDRYAATLGVRFTY